MTRENIDQLCLNKHQAETMALYGAAPSGIGTTRLCEVGTRHWFRLIDHWSRRIAATGIAPSQLKADDICEWLKERILRKAAKKAASGNQKDLSAYLKLRRELL